MLRSLLNTDTNWMLYDGEEHEQCTHCVLLLLLLLEIIIIILLLASCGTLRNVTSSMQQRLSALFSRSLSFPFVLFLLCRALTDSPEELLAPPLVKGTLVVVVLQFETRPVPGIP